MVTLDIYVKFITALEEVYKENEKMLTELDSAIGDADHGGNMRRGFIKVAEQVRTTAPKTISELLKTTSMQLIKTVGGASGPLYGTFFLKTSMASAGKDELNTADIIDMFRKGTDGVIALGKARVGDKTMIDTLLPAVEAMEASAEMSIQDMMSKALRAAERGKHSTIDLVAKKGRASYLGERSAGHQDPGATSSYLLIETAAKFFV